MNAWASAARDLVAMAAWSECGLRLVINIDNDAETSSE